MYLCHMAIMMIRPSQPELQRRACPSCVPGLPMCVACYLDHMDIDRLEFERELDMEGYRER